MKKKIVSILTTFIFLLTMCPISASGSEIYTVKTETWTTSYYIDGNKDVLYPYIECTANIYSNGAIRVYLRNTNVCPDITGTHTVTIVNTTPVPDDSRQYAFKYGNKYFTDGEIVYENTDPDIFDNIDLSFFPSDYIWSGVNQDDPYVSWGTDWEKVSYGYFKNGNWDTFDNFGDIEYFKFRGNISNMNIGEITHNQVFFPKYSIDREYKFRLYGHDITISPDDFNTTKDEYIRQLEEQINQLLNRIDLISSGTIDVNGDGVFSADDPQILLVYYTRKQVAKEKLPSISEFARTYMK